MQETQHTQQITTRTAQNQDIEIAWMSTNIKHRRLTNTRNNHLLREILEFRIGTVSDECLFGA